MVIERFYSYTSDLPNNFHLSFLLGSYVNNQVEVLIVVPLLEILMSTPPESNISKVSELELLTILARHDSLRKGTVLNIPLSVATVKRNVK